MPNLPPIFIDSLLDEPEVFRTLIERHSPYYPVQRYFSSDAEHRASSGSGSSMIVAPNFRGDWAYDKPLVEGAELLLDHPVLCEAARQLFDTPWVRPQIVYTNLTWQLPFDQGNGHTDVPAFRGIDRTAYPIWILNVMGHSGLFEDERINIATAVAWFYRGSDGGFTYWPDGPDQPPKVHEGEIFNTAVMGDNDRMYHRVRPVGERRDGMLVDMTLDTRLEHAGDDQWIVSDSGKQRAAMSYADLRISVSWKAQVFRDERERDRVDDHSDDLAFSGALERFYDDLNDRGTVFQRPSNPLEDADFVDLLAATYVQEPSVFES
jgi:hypothetical protein